MPTDVPRRNQVKRWIPAEVAIHRAMEAVEFAGADERLTDAVLLLEAARASVADWVDGIDTRRAVVVTR